MENKYHYVSLKMFPKGAPLIMVQLIDCTEKIIKLRRVNVYSDVEIFKIDDVEIIEALTEEDIKIMKVEELDRANNRLLQEKALMEGVQQSTSGRF